MIPYAQFPLCQFFHNSNRAALWRRLARGHVPEIVSLLPVWRPPAPCGGAPLRSARLNLAHHQRQRHNADGDALRTLRSTLLAMGCDAHRLWFYRPAPGRLWPDGLQREVLLEHAGTIRFAG